MRVSLFVACFNDLLFPQTGRAIVALLEGLGLTVDFPRQQTCCGQLHFNTGYQREIVPLVHNMTTAFADADVVVAASGSCAAMIRQHYPHMARTIGEPQLVARVDGLVDKVYELSAFLVDRLDVTDVGAYFPHRVTYHPTCHTSRMLGVDAQPLALLRAVRGIDLVDLQDREQCCGFGGTFAVKNADVSTAMLSDKVRHVLDTEAEVLTAADNSCLMHIGGALRRQRAGVRVMHLAEILAARA